MSDMLPMDEILKPVGGDSPPAPDAARPWPQSPPAPGTVYGLTCPATGADMVAMTKDTFLNFGTQMEAMRRANVQLNSRCQELHTAHAELSSLYNDLQRRHEALREKLRSDRLETMEKKIVMPDRKTLKLTR